MNKISSATAYTSNLCPLCKGSRNLCKNPVCPLLAQKSIKPKIQNLKKDFFGPSTSIFVGYRGYPNVFVGPMANICDEQSEAPIHNTIDIADSPSNWFNLSYDKIIELRSLTIRSKFSQNIKSKSRFIYENQLLALAKKPTDVELYFKKSPSLNFQFSSITQPMGPSALLEKQRITENIKIEKSVERIANDDLLSKSATIKLYNLKQDIYKITIILSSGVLGLEKNKKLVPTRWSITATDDMIGKHLIEKIKAYQSINEYMIFSSEFLGNHFEILLMPGTWEFENFETWAPGSFWAQNLTKPFVSEEYESYKGRKSYAQSQVGGYYASRLANLEGLVKIKKQAKIICFREISEQYILPIGVWQVRENIRNAYKNSPIKFPSLSQALNHLKAKLKIPLPQYLKKSKILQQKRLFDF